ncbi:hypothetical protein ABE042_15745 [Viridibacillus arvi]|uniref:hypothetical protein n=1 Tax=Viridibacillus arvi TaxID=263475 RepID=UPI003D28FE03
MIVLEQINSSFETVEEELVICRDLINQLKNELEDLEYNTTQLTKRLEVLYAV